MWMNIWYIPINIWYINLLYQLLTSTLHIHTCISITINTKIKWDNDRKYACIAHHQWSRRRIKWQLNKIIIITMLQQSQHQVFNLLLLWHVTEYTSTDNSHSEIKKEMWTFKYLYQYYYYFHWSFFIFFLCCSLGYDLSVLSTCLVWPHHLIM